MPFAQRLFQRRVQLGGVDIAFVQVTIDQIRVLATVKEGVTVYEADGEK